MCLICRHSSCNNTTQSESRKPHFLHGCARPCPSLWEEEAGTALSWQVELEPLFAVLTLYNQNTCVCLVTLCASLPFPPHPVTLYPSPTVSVLSNLGPIFLLPLALPAAPFPWLASPAIFLQGPAWPLPPAPHCPDLLVSLHPSSCSCPCPGSPLPKHPGPSHCSLWLICTPGFRQLQVLFHLHSNPRSAAWLYPFNSWED